MAGKAYYKKENSGRRRGGRATRPRASRHLGRERGARLRGRYCAAQGGYGFVSVEGAEQDIFIPRRHTGGAFEGDLVEIELFGSEPLSAKPSARGKRREAAVVEILERGLTQIVGTFDAVSAGGGRFLGGEPGTMRLTGGGIVLPDRVRLARNLYIPAESTLGAVSGQKVVAHITDYGDGEAAPHGEIVEILGHVNDPGVDILSVVRAFALPEGFPPEVLAEAARAAEEYVPGRRESEAEGGAGSGLGESGADADSGRTLTSCGMKAVFGHKLRMCGERLDLRGIPMVTIDGADAKDLDDAVSLSYDGEAFYLGVHIADVSEYVREGSVLDEDARERATSVYLTDRVIPMLPHVLSNGMCSLNAGEDRYALSCLMKYDGAGNLQEHEICESLIRVDRRMTYTEVQGILGGDGREDRAGCGGGSGGERSGESYAGNVEENIEENIEENLAEDSAGMGERRNPVSEELSEMLSLMASLAEILRNTRRRRGAIDFDLPECKIEVDADGRVLAVHPYERTAANGLIEEFMIAANECVAEHFYWMDAPFVYRVHDEPDTERIQTLLQTIRAFGISVKGAESGEIHPKEIQRLLARIDGTPQEALITRLALRSMKRAAYSPLCSGHFGLASPYYCHFTSPIRRYPDLQIHRIIKEALRGKLTEERAGHYREILDDVSKQSSARERRADDAEREVERMKKVQYMAGHLGEEYRGIISGVIPAGVFVELPNTVEGMIRLADLPEDRYVYDEAHLELCGTRTGRKYGIGKPIRIRVAAANEMLRTIDFVPADAG